MDETSSHVYSISRWFVFKVCTKNSSAGIFEIGDKVALQHELSLHGAASLKESTGQLAILSNPIGASIPFYFIFFIRFVSYLQNA